MFPFDGAISDAQLQELGWPGMIDSIQSLSDIERSGLDVHLDVLSDQMAALATDHGVEPMLLIQMATTQAEVFQALLNCGRLEQQIVMMKQLHEFLTANREVIEQITAEEA